jgi:hypothetical protein
VGHASAGRGGGNGNKSDGNNVGMIDIIFFMGKLLRGFLLK